VISSLLKVFPVHSVPGLSRQPAAVLDSGFGHENAVMMALFDRHPFKNVVARLPHENAQIIARQDRVLDHIMVEIQVQRNGGREVVVQIQVAEMALFGQIAGQPSNWLSKAV
jgi:hypothetical protein